MKKTEAIKLAEIGAQRDVIVSVLKNPVLALVLGFIALEAAEKAKITGFWSTGVMEAGLVATTTAQALAPILPELTEGAAALAKAFVK